MLLTTYNPQRTFNKSFLNLFADESAYKPAWRPAIDVSETNNAFILTADLPGVKDENLTLTTDNNVLVISGKKESVLNPDEKNLHRIERFAGEFKRQFTLPEEADIENVTANKKDGVLVVEIPKKEKPQAKKISINFN